MSCCLIKPKLTEQSSKKGVINCLRFGVPPLVIYIIIINIIKKSLKNPQNIAKGFVPYGTIFR